MKDLTKGKEAKVILAFSIPILLGNIFQQLYNTIDSIIVGKFLGKNALAAVGFSFNIMLMLLAIATGLTIGTNILVSQYYGAKDLEKVKKSIDTAYVFSFVLSIIIMIIGVSMSERLLILFKVPNEILPSAKFFLNVMLLGTPSSFCYNAISSVLRGLGDSKTPLYFLIISTVLNIILDIIFILVFKLGILGAALATIIAQTISFIGSFIYLNKIYPQFRFDLKNIDFDKDIFKLSLKMGLPSGAQQLFINGGFLIIQVLINNFGADHMAAYAAASKMDAFVQMPALNLGIALSTFVAQNIGANKRDRVKNGYISSLTIGSFISIVATTLIMIFSKSLMHLFTNDTHVIKLGVNYLKIISLCYILYSTMVITNGLLLGFGNACIALFATIISMWCVQIPVSIYLTHKFGINGVWMGVPIGWSAGVILRLGYYFSGYWKKNILTIQIK